MASESAVGVPPDGAPIYAVLFDGTVNAGPYIPVTAEQQGIHSSVTFPHGFDREVVPALPGLWYCLHLPKALFELNEIPPASLLSMQAFDLGHHIMLAPIAAFGGEHIAALLSHGVAVLAVCPDDLLDEATYRCADLGFALPPAPFSQLSSESLEAHWLAIYNLLETDEPFMGSPPYLSRNLKFAPADLPRRWLLRQLDGDNQVLEESDEPQQDAAIERALDAQLFLRIADMAVKGEELPEGDELQGMRGGLRLPMTLAAPGVASGYIARAYEPGVRAKVAKDPSSAAADTWSTNTDDWNDATAELSTVRFLTTHRAMAQGGIGITLPPMPQEAFGVLAQLEEHMRSRAPTGRKVSSLLDRLDSITRDVWTPLVRGAVARASALTVFSNFPIGLLRLPGDTSPLAARVPVTYRPLLPLTRALQAELTYVPIVQQTEHVRVLITECISEDDSVGLMSRRGWDAVNRMLAERASAHISLHIEETPSVESLRSSVSDHRPDILIISAHGVLSPNGSTAGLSIGDETVIGPGLGPLPPVVILSACYVAPRGAGAVSVADLLLREGAIAVLGTQVPVDVRRNMLLTARLLINLADTLAGGKGQKNLLEIWRHVQAGNAVLDVLDGSEKLREWGSCEAPTGRSVLEEFMAVRSVGGLRTGDIYADTEIILGTIADDMNCGDRVRNWFRNPGYVPESLFYSFVGSPERLLFGNGPAD